MRTIVLACCWVLFGGRLSASMFPDRHQDLMDRFAAKDSVSILVTDSGLGGIAVCADIERRLQTEHPFRSVKLVFCNALPESDYGYNAMASTEEKIRLFSDALKGMTAWYEPDIVLIACNTLSVLYDKTEYAKTASIPVISIVDVGVRMMADALAGDATSSLIIFGTETTVESNIHRSLMMQKAIPASRIAVQACPDLAGEIQADASSDAVRTMIGFYSEEAVQKLSSPHGTVFAVLCCTHYGYAGSIFQSAIAGASGGTVRIVDPTTRMSDIVFAQGRNKRFQATTTRVSVISRAAITEAERNSIGLLIRQQSAATAASLAAYELKRNLFEFKRK
ncbi:MAG: aspartate/glutamate racemase family protein [Ignavibacteriales bacterium]|nr:aspartate/glutamate racemase family protein [Ignavibacteriales bacterium]